MKKVLGFVAVLLVGFVLVACGNSGGFNPTPETNDNNGSDDTNDTVETPTECEWTTVTVGVVGVFQDQWDVVNENLADDCIRVELVFFTEWDIPNPALHHGDTDLNAFQTTIFLNNAIDTNGYELAIVGQTFVSPQNIFNGRANIAPDHTRTSLVGYVEDGFTVVIPNDLINGGRALKLLEAAGLITVDPAVGYLAIPSDIIEFHVAIEITAVAANTLPSLVPDFDIAVINNPQAMINGFSANNESIFRENSLNIDIADGLINVIASRAGYENNPVFLRILEAYQTQAVRDVFRDNFDGAFLPAW